MIPFTPFHLVDEHGHLLLVLHAEFELRRECTPNSRPADKTYESWGEARLARDMFAAAGIKMRESVRVVDAVDLTAAGVTNHGIENHPVLRNLYRDSWCCRVDPALPEEARTR